MMTPLIQLNLSKFSEKKNPESGPELFGLELGEGSEASLVELLGETSDWLSPTPMRSVGGGRFEAQLALGTGIYAYKYRVDGVWMLDPRNPRTRSAGGVRNSVRVVNGAGEPLLFACASPFFYRDDDGMWVVVAGLRKAEGDSLLLHYREQVDSVEHVIAMQVVMEEDEHRIFRAKIGLSSSGAHLGFEFGDGRVVRETEAGYPFLVDCRGHGDGVASWWKDAIVYTIFVDRYRPQRDSAEWGKGVLPDAFAGGHLAGIQRSLPELEELGIKAIYLTPIHRGAHCHRYDIVDPAVVDPLLGGEDAFVALLKEVHGRGMRLLLDFSFSHVGRGFEPYEDVLAKGRASRYAGWFLWKSSEELRHYGKRVDAPLLDLNNEEVRALVLVTARKWASFGIDGFRLDAAAEFPRELARQVREILKSSKPDAIVLGELVPAHFWRWRGDGAIDCATDFGYQNLATQFIAQRSIDALEASKCLTAIELRRGTRSSLGMRFLSTHDHPRFASVARLHRDESRGALGFVFLMTSAGVPSLLYGEEYGIASDVVELLPENAWEDRACLSWGERNTHLRDLLVRLCAIRTKSRALREGTQEVVYAEGGLLVFRRAGAGEVVDIAVNASDESVEVELEDDDLDGLEPWVRVGPVQVEGQRVVLGANAGLVAGRRMSSSRQGNRRMQVEGNRRWQKDAFRDSDLSAKIRPLRIDFSLTEKCNLRCAHCINESPMHTSQGSARTMNMALIERLQGDFAYASYFGFVHGGESLSAKESLFEVLEAIKRAKMGMSYTVHLLSNGMLLGEPVIRRLLSLGVNSLSVSLDGATSEVNDAIRKGGRFERILENLRGAVRIRKETGADLRIGVSHVLMKDNCERAEDMAELCAGLGVDWLKLEELVPRGNFAQEQMIEHGEKMRGAARAAMLRAKQLGLRVVEHTQGLIPYACRVKDDEALGEFLRADEYANRSEIDPCRAHWDLACIDPNGDLRIGDFYNPVVGNLMVSTLEELWGSLEAQAHRDRAIEGRPCGRGRMVCL